METESTDALLLQAAGCSPRAWGHLKARNNQLAETVEATVKAHAVASAQHAVLAAEMHRQAQEYGHRASCAKEALECCGIHTDGLSTRARLASSLAVKVASALGCAQATPPHVLAAWAALLVRESKAALFADGVRQAREGLARNVRILEEQAAQLQATADALSAQHATAGAAAAEHGANATHAASKDAEYRRHVDKLRRKLDSLGVTPEVRHSALVVQAEAVGELQEQLGAAQAQLAAYHNLPASALGAGLMLKQARQRLSNLQEALDAQLAHLA